MASRTKGGMYLDWVHLDLDLFAISQRVARIRVNTEFVPLLFFPCCGQKHFDFSKKVKTFLLSQFFGKGPPGTMPVGLFVIP